MLRFGPTMRHLSLLSLVAVLTLGGHALAEVGIDQARSAAAAAQARVGEVRAQQMTMRQELNEVSGKISALKSGRKGKLTRDPVLERSLQRSQELSGSLTELAQELSSAEASAQQRNILLLTALSADLSRLREAFDRTADRSARQKLISSLRALRAEREQVRAQLPSSAVPALETGAPSDDPEDLLEQVDALKDNEDKVRRELKKVEGRITEAREERELDRRMNEFLGDEAMFDEQDRRFRLAPAANERRESGFGSTNAAPTAASDSNAPGGGSAQGAPAPQLTPLSPGTPKLSSGPVERQLLGQTPVGASIGKPIPGDGPSLEAERARLKGLADQLKERAHQLELRARSLR